MRLTQLLPVLVSAAVLVSARTNLTNPLWKEDDVETIDLSDIVAAKLKAGELDLAPSNISSAVGKPLAKGVSFAVRYTFGNQVPETMYLYGCSRYVSSSLIPFSMILTQVYTLSDSSACNGFTIINYCTYLFRQPMSTSCNANTNGKQGGDLTALTCGYWRADPGRWQSDCPACVTTNYETAIKPCFTLPEASIPACLETMRGFARSACEQNGSCCRNSGLGPAENNCDMGPSDW
ncbi:hypothetical protein BDV98DRAFT_652609 [Pterulicium gracile]|uniref:Uncharacterized protein n=1 Tax=Pterulicium gracile TaxID=1884261 RepID=A0A5C3R252_9AGAR|nr:hypothetical protein BDV98DRAFT_652609 [Pterula gracilis]